MRINLGKLSKQTGRTEVELAKTILTLLNIKANVYGIPQKVIMSVEKGKGGEIWNK